ncbi:MAG: hypothetical protein EAY75_17175 [Bacteroidetes bacterium]|nr:MAG: hypothetical protein EAY75_17175 [Bacteroidota bacterium]
MSGNLTHREHHPIFLAAAKTVGVELGRAAGMVLLVLGKICGVSAALLCPYFTNLITLVLRCLAKRAIEPAATALG